MERLSIIYSQALYDLAAADDNTELFLQQTKLLHDVLSDKDVSSMLVNPQIPASIKNDFFRFAFEGKVHSHLLSFLYLVAEKNREQFLLSALRALIDKCERHNKIVKAKVVSAAPYDDKQAEELKAVLTKKLSKSVELDLSVDPILIGGPYIFADGYHIDWTVKNRLRDLTASLKEGCSA